MTQEELKGLLDSLLSQWENEVVEFKRGGKGFSTGEIGEYFSALSNEANLAGVSRAWLVFGVDNKTRKVVGTDYDASSECLNKPGGLKYQITQRTDPGVCFNGVHVLELPEGRLIFFEIPAAPKGIPIAWNGHYYARSGENLVALGLDKLDAIRRQGVKEDWSATVVSGATLADLDETALQVARKGYAEKHARTVSREEVDAWSLPVFLDKARLTRDGEITRTALLLVGKELSAQKLSPYVAQLVWKLVGEECANEIFRPPYLLTTTKLFSRIRNVQVRMVVKGTLRQVEVPKYSERMILEALHNCIAHQDYSRGARIVVTEYVDRLTLENQGSFFFGHPEDYIFGERTPPDYRNPQLVDAMSELNMIDTMGYGIHRMYAEQARRYMPLHDYLLTSQSVTMTIFGHFADEAYSSLLVKRPDLRLEDIRWLDHIQKGLPIPAAVSAYMRKCGWVEGRKPHLRIVANIAENNVSHTGGNSLKPHHRILIDYLAKFPGASRAEINEHMLGEIRGNSSVRVKTAKITNILTYLRRKGLIVNLGSDTESHWKLCAQSAENQ